MENKNCSDLKRLQISVMPTQNLHGILNTYDLKIGFN